MIVEPGVLASALALVLIDCVTFHLSQKSHGNHITCLPYLEMPSSGSGEIRSEKVMCKPQSSTQMVIIATKHEFGPMNSVALFSQYKISVKNVIKLEKFR